MQNLNYTKRNGDICFREEDHKYFDASNPDRQFVSVTTMIHQFTQPFDQDFWSAYKALEKLLPADAWAIEKKSLLSSKKFDKTLLELHGITELDFNKEQQGILDTWAEENRKSCERGTKIHAELENSFYKKGHNIDLRKYQIGGTFECRKDYTDLDMEHGVYPEYLIHYISKDGKFAIAGQIDLLVKNGNHIIIGDWKGLPLDTEIPTKVGFKLLKDIKEGDFLYDKSGNLTKVLHKSEVHHNPCYKITFDNGDTIIADHEHRWEISFKTSSNSKWHGEYRQEVMTTEQIANYLKQFEAKKRTSYDIPKILNADPIKNDFSSDKQTMLIDPYVLGCWLGDGSKQCGAITNETNHVLEEIQRRGYHLGENIAAEDKAPTYTILGIYPKLKEMGLINNKHIPEQYIFQASVEQRLDLLRGLMDTDGYYNPRRKRFVMETSQEWQCYDFIKLLGSLGIKATKFDIVKKLNGKEFHEYSINFSTNGFNPFLMRNQNIEYPTKDCCSFRNIEKVEPCNTVPTLCLEVDSPSHTFLCTDKFIVTHNTNKEIKTKSFFNKNTKSSTKMQYPLNTLDDVNYNHYNLQLSTYAWMIQKLNPEYVIDDLVLVHFDHNDNMAVYHMPYLKDEVTRMLSYYKKQFELQQAKSKRTKIDY